MVILWIYVISWILVVSVFAITKYVGGYEIDLDKSYNEYAQEEIDNEKENLELTLKFYNSRFSRMLFKVIVVSMLMLFAPFMIIYYPLKMIKGE